MERAVSCKALIVSPAEAASHHDDPVESSSQKANLDETFPTPSSLLSAPPLAPELTHSERAAPKPTSGPQLVVPERVPTPYCDPRLRDNFLTRYNSPRAKDDNALQLLRTMGRRLKRRGALAVKDLKILGSHLKVPTFRDSSRRVSAPSAIGGSDHSRSGSSSPVQSSSLSSRPTHARSASHSYAHDLLLHESTVKGCDCAVCDLALRRCQALCDASLSGSGLLYPSTTPRPTPSRPISPITLHKILYRDPSTHDDSETSSSPAKSVEAPTSATQHDKPLPGVPSLPAETAPGDDSSSSDETTRSRHPSPAQSMRRSVRRVPVPQDSDSEPEPTPSDAPSRRSSLSELGELANGLYGYDIGANYVRLQMLGVIDSQKRTLKQAASKTWSTLVADDDWDNWSTLGSIADSDDSSD